MRSAPVIKYIVSRLENGIKDLTTFSHMYHELATRLVPDGVSNNCKEIPGENL